MNKENSGYDAKRFVNIPQKIDYEQFLCPICACVAKHPKECTICGGIFCESCINQWLNTGKKECPMSRCKIVSNEIKPIGKALQKMYRQLDIKCSNEDCEKLILSVYDIEEHEKKCKLPKCKQFMYCKNHINENYKSYCSLSCQLFTELLLKSQPQDLYQVISEFFKTNELEFERLGTQNNIVSSTIGDHFVWNQENIGSGLEISENGKRVFLKETAYMFRTVVGNIPFNSGCHYWEIHADDKTENELKIGVSSSMNFNFNAAFCDYPEGWAYYGLGQLRHGSNATGPNYGKRFKNQGFVGVFLNMNAGTLSFSLNNESMGIAFQDPKLKLGPIYPAVSLLHCAGFRLVCGKPIPTCFNNQLLRNDQSFKWKERQQCRRLRK